MFINVLRMKKRWHIRDLFGPFWNMTAVYAIPKAWFFNKESKKVHNRAARFVTSNYCFETGSMTGILDKLKWESRKKRMKDSRLICFVQRSKECCQHSNSYPPN